MKNAFKSGFAFAVTTRIYVICVVLGILFAVSNFHLLRVAGDYLDSHQNDVEMHLVEAELARFSADVASDQALVSHRDESVRGFYAKHVSKEFLQGRIIPKLWRELAIPVGVVIGGFDRIDAAIVDGQIVSNGEVRDAVRENYDLIARARVEYTHHKARRATGFTIDSDPLDPVHPLYVSDIRLYDGGPAAVTAQAIVPDGDVLVPPGSPKILLTVKPLSAAIIERVKSTMGFDQFEISPLGAVARPTTHSIVLPGSTDSRPLVVAWTSRPDSQTMWEGVAPVMATTFALVVIGLAFLARNSARSAHELAVREAESRSLASRDPLTGLANRLKFDQVLEKLVEGDAKQRWAVACIDLDRFKAVNDTYGHHAGDEVLCRVADIISRMVSDKGLVARMGGDEFIAVFTEDIDRERLHALCDTIIDLISREIPFESGSVRIGASIGIAWRPETGGTAKEVIRAADTALYRAKGGGRGRVCFADELEDRRKSGHLPPNRGRAA